MTFNRPLIILVKISKVISGGNLNSLKGSNETIGKQSVDYQERIKKRLEILGKFLFLSKMG